LDRVALGIAYDGTAYHGWQRQRGVSTVQAELEDALSKIANTRITVNCAGRTDTGVHATQQVVHFDVGVVRTSKAWIEGTNALLPDDIAVVWMQPVSSAFDARRSAIARRYLYIIYNKRRRSPIASNLYARYFRDLQPAVMHEAAQTLVGEQDFSSFRAAHCQARTPIRNIHSLTVKSQGSLVFVDITANAFLYHMVRNIIGVLLEVGCGNKPLEWVGQLLAMKDRSRAGKMAPACGLYLVSVGYPDQYQLPAGPQLPHLIGLLPIE
jgi:tRNA pseudouridine38-40 synthase